LVSGNTWKSASGARSSGVVANVTVTGPRAGELAHAGGEALVERAARAWAHETGREAPGATITVDKRIPVAAGLGGGSADAAAAILALDELQGTDLATETLVGIAAAVGSDVPALLLGGPVYADGRGDRVTSVHAQTTHWVVVPASFAVRTPDAYGWWDARARVAAGGRWHRDRACGSIAGAVAAGDEGVQGVAAGKGGEVG